MEMIAVQERDRVVPSGGRRIVDTHQSAAQAQGYRSGEAVGSR